MNTLNKVTPAPLTSTMSEDMIQGFTDCAKAATRTAKLHAQTGKAETSAASTYRTQAAYMFHYVNHDTLNAYFSLPVQSKEKQVFIVESPDLLKCRTTFFDAIQKIPNCTEKVVANAKKAFRDHIMIRYLPQMLAIKGLRDASIQADAELSAANKSNDGRAMNAANTKAANAALKLVYGTAKSKGTTSKLPAEIRQAHGALLAAEKAADTTMLGLLIDVKKYYQNATDATASEAKAFRLVEQAIDLLK